MPLDGIENKSVYGGGAPWLIKIERCVVCFLPVEPLKVLNVQLYSVDL